MEKNEICVIYGKDYKEMTKKILRTSELAELIPSKDTLVGIKPNLVSPSEASLRSDYPPGNRRRDFGVSSGEWFSKNGNSGRFLGWRSD